ncbi:MAG: hypothetical protein ACO1QB_17520, partial [Verrucomicrobiales bacterium]
GNVINCTLSNGSGSFIFDKLEPGSYSVRATPLDAPHPNSLLRMLTGNDINSAFANARTDFVAVTNRNVNLDAGQLTALHIEVEAGAPSLRLTRLLIPSPTLETISVINSPVTLSHGSSNYLVGVCTPDLPVGVVELGVTGSGIEIGKTEVITNVFPGSNPALHLLYAPATVGLLAPPGLRSLEVRHGSESIYLNGFLEVRTAEPDFNFDQLSDLFQRRHFARFTGPDASPFADPDADEMINLSEHVAGTNPTSNHSRLEISSITRTATGSTVRWQSIAGKTYRLLFRGEVDGSDWIELGLIVASSSETEFAHMNSSGSNAFYQVEVIP